MKIALCTTTIHVPHALKLMRKCSPDVRFFVAMDIGTPKDEVLKLGVDNFEPLMGDRWKCSDAIG